MEFNSKYRNVVTTQNRELERSYVSCSGSRAEQSGAEITSPKVQTHIN